MKNLLVLFISTFLSVNVFAAGSDGGGSSETSMYDEVVKLVKLYIRRIDIYIIYLFCFISLKF